MRKGRGGGEKRGLVDTCRGRLSLSGEEEEEEEWEERPAPSGENWGVVGGATPSPQRGGSEGGLSSTVRRLFYTPGLNYEQAYEETGAILEIESEKQNKFPAYIIKSFGSTPPPSPLPPTGQPS